MHWLVVASLVASAAADLAAFAQSGEKSLPVVGMYFQRLPSGRPTSTSMTGLLLGTAVIRPSSSDSEFWFFDARWRFSPNLGLSAQLSDPASLTNPAYARQVNLTDGKKAKIQVIGADRAVGSAITDPLGVPVTRFDFYHYDRADTLVFGMATIDLHDKSLWFLSVWKSPSAGMDLVYDLLDDAGLRGIVSESNLLGLLSGSPSR